MADEVTDNRGVSESEKEFGEAFDKAAEIVVPAELSPADDPANIQEEPPVVETPPVVEVPAEKPPVVPDPAAQQPGESDEKYEQRYKTLQGIHRHDKETWEIERASLLAQVEEAKKAVAPEVKKETIVPEAIEDSLSDKDKEELKQYEEDFYVISRMEGKKRETELKRFRKDFEGFIQGIKDELKKEFSAQIAPATEFVKLSQEEREKRSEEEHFSAIRNAHPDFETYRDNGSIQDWIESKPKYLQKGMLEVYKKGTAEDVVEFLNDFKTGNNIPIQSSSSENVVQISTKKAEKKLAMTAVTTRRGAVNTSMPAVDDYDSAFDEAVRKQGGK